MGRFSGRSMLPSQDQRAIAAGWGADRPLDVWPEARLAESIRNVRRRSEERLPVAEVPFGLAAS